MQGSFPGTYYSNICSFSGRSKSTRTRELSGRKTAVEDETVQRLKYSQIIKATEAMNRASIDDPVGNYLFDGKPHPGVLGNLATYAELAVYIRTKITYTIDAGKAICVASYAKEDHSTSSSNGSIDTVVDAFKDWLRTKPGDSATVIRRRNEFIKKLSVAIVETFGSKTKEMMSLDTISTDPDYQGRGWGGKLLEAINDIADARGRDIWLISSNYANTGFYNSHGYQIVREIILGDEDPTWDKSPFIVTLMLRKVKGNEKVDLTVTETKSGI